eukprot:6206747-Pleurochrysis_carterae.AAC.2
MALFGAVFCCPSIDSEEQRHFAYIAVHTCRLGLPLVLSKQYYLYQVRGQRSEAPVKEHHKAGSCRKPEYSTIGQAQQKVLVHANKRVSILQHVDPSSPALALTRSTGSSLVVQAVLQPVPAVVLHGGARWRLSGERRVEPIGLGEGAKREQQHVALLARVGRERQHVDVAPRREAHVHDGRVGLLVPRALLAALVAQLDAVGQKLQHKLLAGAAP